MPSLSWIQAVPRGDLWFSTLRSNSFTSLKLINELIRLTVPGNDKTVHFHSANTRCLQPGMVFSSAGQRINEALEEFKPY